MLKLSELSRNPANAIELGKAAEHIVCADLILNGYRAYLSDQALPYDVVVDIDGKLIRIQVKGSCFPKNMNMRGRYPSIGYNFSVRIRGKRGSQRLTELHCDVIALVALDIRIVAYLPLKEVGTTCQLREPGFSFNGKYKRSRVLSIDQLPFRRLVGSL